MYINDRLQILQYPRTLQTGTPTRRVLPLRLEVDRMAFIWIQSRGFVGIHEFTTDSSILILLSCPILSQCGRFWLPGNTILSYFAVWGQDEDEDEDDWGNTTSFDLCTSFAFIKLTPRGRKCELGMGANVVSYGESWSVMDWWPLRKTSKYLYWIWNDMNRLGGFQVSFWISKVCGWIRRGVKGQKNLSWWVLVMSHELFFLLSMAISGFQFLFLAGSSMFISNGYAIPQKV